MSHAHSPVQQRKAREADARRTHIFAVVKALIKKGGAGEVTIRRVAHEAGFSTTVVYSLFKDKATLITRAMDDDLLALVGAMRAAAATGGSPVERLRLAGQAYVQFGLQHPDEYALVFMEPRPHTPVDAAEVEHGNTEQDPYAFAYSLMQAAAAEDEATVHLMAHIFWQGLHGMVSLALVMGKDPWFPSIAPQTNVDALMDVLLAGLGQRFRFGELA